MFAILIGTCPNCGHATHKEVGSIGRSCTDACPNCRLLYSEDGQTTSALVGRVYEWQKIKQFHEANTFEELSEKLNALAKEHHQDHSSAWNFHKNENLSELCKLGGLMHSVSYGLNRLKHIENQTISGRIYYENQEIHPTANHLAFIPSQVAESPF